MRFGIIDERQDVLVVVVLVAWWDKEAANAMNDGYLVVICCDCQHGKWRYLLAKDADAIIDGERVFFPYGRVKKIH